MIWVFTLVGCNLAKPLGPALDSIEARAYPMGEDLARGVVAGVDTSRLDSLLTRLVHSAFAALDRDLNALALDSLQQELSTTLRTILRESVADPVLYASIREQLFPIVDDLLTRLNRAGAEMGPRVLNDSTLLRLLLIRDALLGDSTAALLAGIINKSLDELAHSPHIDSLILKVDLLRSRTTEGIGQSTKEINKTVITLGVVIAVLLLMAIALIYFYYRKRREAADQEALIFELTKAIDSIPSRDTYDKVVRAIQEGASHRQVNDTLNEILDKYEEEYPEKKRYKNYYERLVELLRSGTTGRSIDPDLEERLEREDPAFQAFVREVLFEEKPNGGAAGEGPV